MKKLVTLAGILFVVFCIEPAFGQYWQTVAKVKVPFEFVVGSTTMPAGTYAVQLDSEAQALCLLNPDNGSSAIALLHNIYLSTDAPIETKLMFAFDGQRHVLHQVVVDRDNHIHDLIHGTEVAELAAFPST